MNLSNQEKEKIILLATHNPNKVKRFQNNLKLKNIKIVSTQDLKLNTIEVQENGKDEYENSKIKAKAYFQKYNIPSLAIDTGFYIEGLTDDKQPGKHVQRIAGVLETDSDETRFKKMTNFYMQIAKNQGGIAKAQFKDVFCLFDGSDFKFQEAFREAVLTDKIFQKDVHFPIASIYKVSAFNKYYHQLSEAEMVEYIKPSLEAIKRFFT
jgi:8-oxo-dGTP diphosphatase